MIGANNMNNKFNIVLKDDFHGKKGIVDATFYIDIEEILFPEAGWTDFVIIVLDWWINSIIDIYFQQKAEFTLQFMDGPYYVECHKTGEQVHMSFIEDKNKTTSIYEYEIKFNELVNNVVDVSLDLVQMLKRKYKRKVCRLTGTKEFKKSLKYLMKISGLGRKLSSGV